MPIVQNPVLECNICLSQPLKNPYSCIKCQQLICEQCLNKIKSDPCPFCRNDPFITFPCDRLINQILSNATGHSNSPLSFQDSNSNGIKSKEFCRYHNYQELRYWCQNCKKPACSDCCALQNGKHHGHTVSILHDVYQDHINRINLSVKDVQCKIDFLSNQSSKISDLIKQIVLRKEKHFYDISTLFDRMKCIVDERYNEKIQKLNLYRNANLDDINSLQSLIKESNRQIEKCSEISLIQKSEEIRSLLQELNNKDDFKSEEEYNNLISESMNINDDKIENDIYPTYVSGELIIPNFQEFLDMEYIYSEPIYSNGCSWRLKLYPKGTGATGEYMSIFLELQESLLREAITYDYRIKLCRKIEHQDSNDIRQFSSLFEKSESWGYNRFITLKKVFSEEEGILHDDGSLHILFQVRPFSLIELGKEQKAFIEKISKDLSFNHSVTSLYDNSSYKIVYIDSDSKNSDSLNDSKKTLSSLNLGNQNSDEGTTSQDENSEQFQSSFKSEDLKQLIPKRLRRTNSSPANITTKKNKLNFIVDTNDQNLVNNPMNFEEMQYCNLPLNSSPPERYVQDLDPASPHFNGNSIID